MTPLAPRLLAAAFVLAAASAASAATISESSTGDFSGSFVAPTVIANGATTVSGVWSGGNDYDLLAFTGLKTGAQQIKLSFAPLAPIGDQDWSFSAGGMVNYKTTPFQYSAWEGTTLANVGIQHWNRGNTFDYVLTLDDSFAGDLYLGLFNTHGTLGYNIDAPGNIAALAPSVPPAPVTLPAAALLLIGGLGALGLVARRRKSV